MSIHFETDKDKTLGYRLLYPYYSDDRFRRPQTIFLAPNYTLARDSLGYEVVKGVSYDYSDRIYSWFGAKKWDEAQEAVKTEEYAKDSPVLIEALLRQLYDDPELKLVHILAGINVGNGYPYQIFGYIRGHKAQDKKG